MRPGRQWRVVGWCGPGSSGAEEGSTMQQHSHERTELTRLAAEIATLEAETFQIADYAESTKLFVAGASCCSCSSCSCTSCCSCCSTAG
jgi:thiazolylpeptide-type bacteriocin precursor